VLICVLPVLLAALVVARAWTQFSKGEGGFKLGVDLAGGTILVYEVEGSLPEGTSINDLAASLKRRLDPADLYNITIRPVGTNRVEIILPTGTRAQVAAERQHWKDFLAEVEKKWPDKTGKGYEDIPRGQTGQLLERIQKEHREAKVDEIKQFITEHYKTKSGRRELTGEEVERFKELIQRQGLLEFRILANNRDDEAGIKAAQDFFERAKSDKSLQRELQARAVQGLPPPPPTNAQGGTTFPAAKDSVYSYSWMEMGRDERASLNLDNAAENDTSPYEWASGMYGPRNQRWKEVEAARKRGEPYLVPGSGILIYSRKYEVPQPPADDKNKNIEYFILTRDPVKGEEVTGEFLDPGRIGIGTDDKLRPEVRFGFNTEGGNRFYRLTSKNAPTDGFKRQLAIVMDNKIVSAPTINSAIHDSGVIQGIRDRKEVENLVRILKSGRLPATLKQRPVSENTIGATLGEDTITAGTRAVMFAFVAVLAFMIIYYRFAGLVACVALFANLLLTVAIMVWLNSTFTLPGLAGLVLMLGMAVDANVLIYERLREERDRGASLALAIRNGYDRAFPTIIDTHLTSIFTAIVLYVVGNDQLKGFGVSLTLGLITSLFTSLYMTRTFFDVALAENWLSKLSMMRLLTRPNINFMGIRYAMFTFTVMVSILGVGLFLVRGKQGLNIDFNGGTAYTGELKEMKTIEQVRALLGQQKEKLQVKDVEPVAGDPTAFVITYADGKSRLVHVDKSRADESRPPTAEEVAERASELPDPSLELTFLDNPKYSAGDQSKIFTVRTSEKSLDLVQAAVSRLLANELKETRVTFEIVGGADEPARTAVLRFTDAEGNPADASPSRVTALLAQELRQQGLRDMTRELSVKGKGGENEGLYQEMEVTLPEAVDRAKFQKALEGLQTQFADTPQPERLEIFDSQLAQETQRRALIAILASWGAILLYLWFRFGNWTFGLAAVLCLIHDLCFTLGAIAACHYIDAWAPGLASVLGLQDFKLDLAAVASLLTLVGYSVNDTIVVFDRIREVRGKNPALTPQMINDSVNQTLSRTLLTSLTTWLVVIVLYIIGGPGVHLFAFVMVVGVVIGTYSSIYVASPLLLVFGEGRQPTPVRERPTEPAGAPA
jgi:SecD/SecF fusion protein